jgi:uncharacterized protein (TIGR01777 family)
VKDFYMPFAPSSRVVAVTGASGLVGRALLPALRAAGYQVISLVRRTPQQGEVRWDPAGRWSAAPLDGIEAVVHLAGEGIADRRWSPARKAAIRNSRVEGTQSLVGALRALPRPPRSLISASAMGYYGDGGDTLLPDTAPAGSDFLGKVAVEWEGAAHEAESAGIRVAILRFGLILAPDGGALGKMLLPFKLGVGGRLGSGKQWMSWITRDDLVRLIVTAVADDRYRGAINAVTPNPVTNSDFTKALGAALHRPAILPVPSLGLRLLFGELADATLLAGQRLVPARLQELGFEWQQPELRRALAAILQDR